MDGKLDFLSSGDWSNKYSIPVSVCPSEGCHQNVLEKFTMVYKSDIKLNLNLKIFNRIYIDWTLVLFVGDESKKTMSLNKF